MTQLFLDPYALIAKKKYDRYGNQTMSQTIVRGSIVRCDLTPCLIKKEKKQADLYLDFCNAAGYNIAEFAEEIDTGFETLMSNQTSCILAIRTDNHNTLRASIILHSKIACTIYSYLKESLCT